MRRPLLISLMTLGLVVTAVGGMGVFAPFTDRATTGTNTVTSGERPRAADLDLAWNVDSIFECDTATFVDDSTTAGVSAADAQPGFQATTAYCLKNNGSAALTVSVTPIDLVDTDTACTGDEAAAGDATCGGDAAGELSSVLVFDVSVVDCVSGSGPVPTFGGFLSDTQTVAVGTVQPGATVCGSITVRYPNNRPATDVLQAQTDTATWRYAFDGVTSS